MKTLIFITLLLVTSQLFAQDRPTPNPNTKYIKWQTSSYFRGYNLMFNSAKTLQDFKDFRNYGGNLFHIGIYGFMGEDSPYPVEQGRIDTTDIMVNYCRQAGIYYVIAVRSGPGAYDTYLESSGQTPASRIWNTGDTTEQRLYGNMLQMIVQRYKSDTLFVGVNLVIEPRPEVRSILTNDPATYKMMLEDVYNIHMDRVYTGFVSAIRAVDGRIPIILENYAYTTPELFPAYTVSDPYLIYSFHDYQPLQYTKATTAFSVSYPGDYYDITYLAQELFDSAFTRNTVLARVKSFQAGNNNVPILMGEFGMELAQNGGDQFIKDVLGTCKDYGWHFALWTWRTGTDWNIESFTDENHTQWKTVLSEFNAPPVPSLHSPVGGLVVNTVNPSFVWDSLTSYTTYDIEIFDDQNNLVVSASDLPNSDWTYSGNSLQQGKVYGWQVRSKNPGGQPANWSNWSARGYFTTSKLEGVQNTNQIPGEFKLSQNYPNPFNPTTVINYQLATGSFVTLKVFDITGREVKSLVNGVQNAGKYYISLDASNFPSGVYFYRLIAGNYSEVRKMILLK